MLQGLHLFAFDPKSIKVSTSCLNKINRLRAAYRPDLKPYPLPAPPKPAGECKLTGSVQHNEPTPKNPCGANPGSLNKGKQCLGTSHTALPNKTPTKRKRTEFAKPRAEQPAKKARSASETDVVFCSKNQAYLTNFIQWMSCGSAPYVILWALDFIGQTK